MPRHQIRFAMKLGLFLGLMVLTSVACALIDSGDDATTEEFVDASEWVSYGGERDILVGAPAGTWRGITFDLAEAYNQGVLMAEQDPTVNPLYNHLVTEYVSKDDTQLVLMRNDGTAWLVVTEETLNGTDLNTRITAIQQNQRAQNRNPMNETTVKLSIGEATRWEIAYSPQGSQIVNRQWHYVFERNGVMIHMIFDAQSTDFDDYKPVFHTIADTLKFKDEI